MTSKKNWREISPLNETRYIIVSLALFPGTRIIKPGRAWYLLSHDVISKGPEQKKQQLDIFQPTAHAHLMLSVYDIHPPLARHVCVHVCTASCLVHSLFLLC